MSNAPDPGMEQEPDETPLSSRGSLSALRMGPTDTDDARTAMPPAFRLDAALRPAPPSDAAGHAEPFETLWPSGKRPAKAPPAGMESKPAAAETETRTSEHSDLQKPHEAAEAHAVSILKSGVIDEMAYTLYSDGSIEAELPQGTMRFGSITELRAYLEKAP
jgi:hypothetical protein